MTEIRRRCRDFQYIDIDDARLLYSVALGMGGWVYVIGHPDHGCYEWLVLHEREEGVDDPQRIEHSDCGYGSTTLALRDGLIAALPLP